MFYVIAIIAGVSLMLCVISGLLSGMFRAVFDIFGAPRRIWLKSPRTLVLLSALFGVLCSERILPHEMRNSSVPGILLTFLSLVGAGLLVGGHFGRNSLERCRIGLGLGLGAFAWSQLLSSVFSNNIRLLPFPYGADWKILSFAYGFWMANFVGRAFVGALIAMGVNAIFRMQFSDSTPLADLAYRALTRLLAPRRYSRILCNHSPQELMFRTGKTTERLTFFRPVPKAVMTCVVISLLLLAGFREHFFTLPGMKDAFARLSSATATPMPAPAANLQPDARLDWQKTLNWSENAPDYAGPYEIRQVADDMYAVGVHEPHYYDHSLYMIKGNGDELWKTSYANMIPDSIQTMPDRTIVLTGYAHLGDSIHSGRAIRLNAQGDEMADHDFDSVLLGDYPRMRVRDDGSYLALVEDCNGEELFMLSRQSLESGSDWPYKASPEKYRVRLKKAFEQFPDDAQIEFLAALNGLVVNDGGEVFIGGRINRIRVRRLVEFSPYQRYLWGPTVFAEMGESLILKLDHEGHALWETRVSDGFDRLEPMPNGGVTAEGDHIVMQFAHTGKIAWTKTLNAWIHAILATPRGTLMLAGEANRRAWLAEIDQNGKLFWEETFQGGDQMDRSLITALCLTDDGGYLAGGRLLRKRTNADGFDEVGWLFRVKPKNPSPCEGSKPSQGFSRPARK